MTLGEMEQAIRFRDIEIQNLTKALIDLRCELAAYKLCFGRIETVEEAKLDVYSEGLSP